VSPYERIVITVMIDVGEALRNWGFDFILTGYHRADIACQQPDDVCCCISI
jgi:hypothetical protein